MSCARYDTDLWFLATEQDSEEHRQDNDRNGDEYTNGYVGLLLCLLNEILQESQITPRK